MNDLTQGASVPAKRETPKDFPGMLKVFQSEIARALPKHLDPTRMARIALTAFRSNPFLENCDPKSVFASVIQSSQLGLEVGLMGEAHLVPFKTKDGWKCQLIPGYQGLMKLARNSGLVQDIYAHEVRANDKFDLTLGMTRELHHEPMTQNGFPAGEKERGEVTGFYAVGIFKDGTKTFQAMSVAEVNRIRDNSKGYQAAKNNKRETPWDSEYLQMGLKTVIRRLCKYLPKSPELAAALAMESAADRGKDQKLDVDAVIEGTWAPAPDEEDAEDATHREAEAQHIVIPALDEKAFEKKLKSWATTIAEGKKTSDEVVAFAQLKNALTPEQVASILALDADRQAPDTALVETLKRAEEAAISDADMKKHLGVTSLTSLTNGQLAKLKAFIADPVGAQS